MTQSVISEICNETNLLIDNTEDISPLLQLWEEIDSGLKEFKASNEKIRAKIKNFLKEREWKHYNDEQTKISVGISEVTKESFDKKQLKIMLTDSQYSEVTNIKTFERMNIITEKRRKELNAFIRK